MRIAFLFCIENYLPVRNMEPGTVFYVLRSGKEALFLKLPKFCRSPTRPPHIKYFFHINLYKCGLKNYFSEKIFYRFCVVFRSMINTTSQQYINHRNQIIEKELPQNSDYIFSNPRLKGSNTNHMWRFPFRDQYNLNLWFVECFLFYP